MGATYKVEAKPSDPALGFGAEAEPFANPVLTLLYLVRWAGYEGTDEETSWVLATELGHATEILTDFHSAYPAKPGPWAR